MIRKQFLTALLQAGVTQVDIAKSLGLSPSTVWRKINGISEWTLGELHQINQAYNIGFEIKHKNIKIEHENYNVNLQD